MIVVITGLDGTGKTSTVNELRNIVKNASFVAEPYPGDNLTFKLVRKEMLQLNVKWDNHIKVIYDRATLLEDMVYERLFTGRQSYFEGDPMIDRVFSKIRFVYLTTDIDTLKIRLKKRGDDYVTPDQLEQLDQKYREVFEKYGIKPLEIDTTMKRPDEVASIIKREIDL